MESEEQKQTIKVVDKRRFSEDGENPASADEPTRESRSSSASDMEINPGPKEPIESSQIDAGPGAAGPSSLDPNQDAPGQEALGQAGGPVTLDFSSFIMGLATQALIMLGEVPDPNTQLVSINLEAARQTIDALAIIEEKTKGNLTDNEARLMNEVVAGLRMSYVEKVNQPA